MLLNFLNPNYFFAVTTSVPWEALGTEGSRGAAAKPSSAAVPPAAASLSPGPLSHVTFCCGLFLAKFSFAKAAPDRPCCAT